MLNRPHAAADVTVSTVDAAGGGARGVAASTVDATWSVTVSAVGDAGDFTVSTLHAGLCINGWR